MGFRGSVETPLYAVQNHVFHTNDEDEDGAARPVRTFVRKYLFGQDGEETP
jgi:hypothetical protein